MKVDRYSRTVYDRMPEPPPKGPRGDDRITICEDTDGDGRADHFKDFVTGLNLCTGLAFGHGGVYVLQVPYLLFYPDRNRDDVPDGDPEVLLSGFGMEDAQSLANHLTWGPDGWLYGVTGSTSSNHVRGVEFQQAVWRFHPLSRRFELFCEGGGNLFGLTFDADGNLFFSSNGIDLAYHAVQGAYYRKNFGKHGPLHNPHAYGFFEHLPYDQAVAGPRPGGTVYLGDALPERFRGTLLCCDFLQHSASWWRLARRGSTFAADYGGHAAGQPRYLVLRPRPVPGARRLRLSSATSTTGGPPTPTPTRAGTGATAGSTASPRRARARSAALTSAARRAASWSSCCGTRTAGTSSRPASQLAARRDREHLAALDRTGPPDRTTPGSPCKGSGASTSAAGFDDAVAAELLRHPGEYVRAWTVRLLGDGGTVSATLGPAPRGAGGDRPERDRPLPARRHGASPARRRTACRSSSACFAAASTATIPTCL